MILKLPNTPTDAEYIQAFRENNNPLINRFLRQQRGKFIAYIKTKLGIKSESDLDEIFQDAIVRLWENVQSDTFVLSGSLSSYVIGIGINVAHEFIRGHKYQTSITQEETDGQEDKPENEYIDMTTIESVEGSFKPITKTQQEVWAEGAWIDAVENPYNKFVQEGHSPEECAEEWQRLAEMFDHDHKKKSPLSQIPDVEDYRSVIIKDVVDNMGKPCKPLLLTFYGEGKSWADIAIELEYSGADSAKTQKNKCMGKLKSIVTNRLKTIAL